MVLLVLLYVGFFAIGSGPVTWVVLSEVLPPAIKGPAASLATAAAWTGEALLEIEGAATQPSCRFNPLNMYASSVLVCSWECARCYVVSRWRSKRHVVG